MILRLLWLAAALLAAPIAAEETAVAEGKVEATVDARADARIEERLRATFGTLEALDAVAVEVRAGVVRLRGEVLSADARELAGRLATQVEGVTAVENEIEETRSLERRLGAVVERLEDRALAALGSLPLLGVALVVIVAFALLAGLIRRWDGLYRRLTPNVFLQDLARQAFGAGMLLAGVLLALELLDATALVGTVLGAAGLAGLAIGFAFRDLIENYVSSILLSLRQPFAPNDHVMIGEQEGKVVRLTPRATILLSLEGNHVRIPNASVFKGAIVNFSRKPERRFDFAVGVGVEQDLTRARGVALETLASLPGVLSEPEPTAVVEALGDSSVVLRIFGWIDQRQADWLRVRSEAIRNVKEAFDRAGIEMPEPIQRVRVETSGQATPAVEPEAPAPETAAREAPALEEIAPDSHLDREIEAERASQEPDLLDPGAPQE